MRADKGKQRSNYISKIDRKYKSYVNKSNAYELTMDFTEEEFKRVIRNPCCYCGSSYNIGLTRIDLHEGFTYDNTKVCCGDCSMMKNMSSEREFLSHIRRIFQHQQEQHHSSYQEE